jgi:hypothetical protein
MSTRVRVVVCCGCKGECVSPSSNLNRSKERKARGGGRIPGGGACHCWPRPSRLGLKEGVTALIEHALFIALIGRLGWEGKEGGSGGTRRRRAGEAEERKKKGKGEGRG